MATITAKDVAALRERTSCGMMDCKRALVEADGDMDKAIDILREKGLAKQAKKAGRIAAEGAVWAIVDKEKKAGAVVEVNAETDFVAKNEKFVEFTKICAQTIIDNSPADVAALSECKASGSDETIASLLSNLVLTIGENIQIRRFHKYDGTVISYVHGGGKIGVLVNFETSGGIEDKPEFEAYAKDVAMQIAAMNPQYLEEKDVPEEVFEKEKAIRIEQLKNDEKNANKPDNILEKIVMGKMGKFYEEVCLLKQTFVKDNSINVDQYTKNTAKELGGDIKICGFVRFEKGEGLQKREDNFAEEIAALTGGNQ